MGMVRAFLFLPAQYPVSKRYESIQTIRQDQVVPVATNGGKTMHDFEA